MTLGSRYHLRPPTKAVLQAGLLDIFQQLNWDKSGIEVLSHSFGTIVHGQLLKAQPGLVKRSCFVDPVYAISSIGEAPLLMMLHSVASACGNLMCVFVACS